MGNGRDQGPPPLNMLGGGNSGPPPLGGGNDGPPSLSTLGGGGNSGSPPLGVLGGGRDDGPRLWV